jgi:cytochrome c oxidase assembly protein subunit 15
VGTILLLAVLVLVVRVRRSEPDEWSLRLSTALLTLIGAQYLLGVVTLVYFVPVSLGVLHQAMAMAIAGVWVVWAHNVHNL